MTDDERLRLFERRRAEIMSQATVTDRDRTELETIDTEIWAMTARIWMPAVKGVAG